MATKNIVPRGNGEGGLGTAAKGWGGAFLTSVAASSTSAGAKLQLISNDNAVLADTHQLGIIEFLGSEGGGTVSLGASIEAVADELFAANQNASALVFKTTSGTTVSEVLRLDKSKLATFAGGLDIAGAVDIAGDLTLSAGADGALNFSAASSIKILDNSATSLVIEEADTAYMTFVTTNSSEAIKFDKALDINAAVQLDSTLTVGVNDTGYDVKFFGATSGKSLLWDESEDSLIVTGTTDLIGTTNLDIVDIDGAVNIGAEVTLAAANKIIFNDASQFIHASSNAILNLGATDEIDLTATAIDVNGTMDVSGAFTTGVNDTGVDVRFFSATINEGVLYDASQDELGLLLTTKLKFHDIGGGEEIFASANGHLEINAGTTLDITAPTVDVNGAMDVSGEITATGFTGTLDGILGSGAAAAATVTTLNTSGVVNLNLTTDSTSSTSGALIVDGGVGIAAKLFVGTDLAVGGTGAFIGDVTFTGASYNAVWDTSANLLQFADNAVIRIGTDNDLDIFHSSNKTFIKTQTDLPVSFIDAGAADILKLTPNGAVDLYHNGTLSLSTVSGGGVVVPDSRTIGCASDDDLLTLSENTLTVAGAGTFTGQVNVNNGNINFGFGQNALIGVSQANGSTAGRNIVIRAGNATTGTTDNLKGGDIDIRSGTAAGTGHTKIDFNATLVGNSDGAITKIASISDYYAVEGGATSSGVGGINADHSLGGRLNIHTGSRIAFPRQANDAAACAIYVEAPLAGGSSTYKGLMRLQAGGNGSGAYGGSIDLYGHAHASLAGDVNIGLSAVDGAKFTVKNQGGGLGSDQFIVNRSGNVTVSTGNLVIGAEGKGIDFSNETPSGAGAAGGVGNILDDYEEGTWTPTFGGLGSGSVGYTSDRGGLYTKVGRKVTVIGALLLNAMSGADGDTIIQGLPFTVANSGEKSVAGITIGIIRNLTIDQPNVKGYTSINSTQIVLTINDSENGYSSFQSNTLKANTSLYFTATYFTTS